MADAGVYQLRVWNFYRRLLRWVGIYDAGFVVSIFITTTTTSSIRVSFGIPTSSAPNGYVSENATFRPVPSTCLAEVPWLREVVVVVITELGVHGLASRTPQSRLLVLLRWVFFHRRKYRRILHLLLSGVIWTKVCAYMYQL